MSQEMSEHNVQSDSSMEAMKVTFLGDGWTSSTGGLATLNRELAIQLSQHPQAEVCLLVPDGHCTDEDKSEAKKHGITVVSAKKRPGYDEPLDWLGAPPEGHKMDVVVGHGANLGRQVQFIKDSARFDNCKWVQVVHTAPEDLSKYKGYSDRISKGEKKHEVEVELCKLADLIVPIGPRLEEVYSSCLQRYKRDTCIFPVIPGLFDREFGGLEQSPNGNGEFKVLLCGRADEEDFELKGYNLAAEAFTDDRLKRKRYSLLFVGAPEGKQEVVRERFLQCGITQEQLTVKTFVKSREKMKDLLCEVDLAIMPSRSEGFGLVALEALSAGLPILVNSKSGFARALEELPCSDVFIVNSDEPSKWAEAIEGVHKRHRNRLQEITLLRTSYDKRYSWKEQCGNFVEKLRTIVHGSSTGSVKIPIADRPIQEQSAAAAVAPDKGLSGQQPSSDEEKKVFGVNEENETSGVQSRSLQKERKQKTSRSTFDLDIRLTIGIKINPEGLNGEQRKEFEEFLLQRWQRFKDNNDISSAEGMGELIEHLTASRGLFLKEIKKGCLEITVVCPTLESLESLWNDYRCGQLNEILEKYLVTDEIKEKLNLENVTLQTTIPEEDYIKAKTSFMKISDMSNIQKGKQSKKKVLEIPRDKVRLLIARQRERVREIRKQTGAQIYIKPDSRAHLRETVEQREKSRKIIEEVLNPDATGEGNSNRVGFKKLQNLLIPEQVIRHIIGKGRESLNTIETKTKVKLRVINNEFYITASTEEKAEKLAVREIRELVPLDTSLPDKSAFYKVCLCGRRPTGRRSRVSADVGPATSCKLKGAVL